ncbi:MAG TPA: signal peptide peptidase SppA [Hyphomicrobiales bacterium]|nr:signal peptide peptidase SppA [Hyphomicrobiales bacterium]
MAAQTDWVLENRRLRGRARLWRVLALLIAAVAIAALAWRGIVGGLGGREAPHIARVALDGLIVPNQARHKLLQEIGKSSAVKGVIVTIDSPGGGVTASEEIYDDLRALSAKKPVVALMGSLAASGGYLAALGADHIVARRTSLTGSIGVLVEYPNFTKLLDTVGVSVEAIKSAPLKAEPSGVRPTSPEARAAMQAIVMDSFDWFKGLVGRRRGISGAVLDHVTDGRVFTGGQALQLHLIDAVGNEDQARDWLATRGVPKSLPVLDWKISKSFFARLPLGRALAADVLDAFGLSTLAAELRAAGGTLGDLQSLDGLLAVWHP